MVKPTANNRQQQRTRKQKQKQKPETGKPCRNLYILYQLIDLQFCSNNNKSEISPWFKCSNSALESDILESEEKKKDTRTQ